MDRTREMQRCAALLRDGCSCGDTAADLLDAAVVEIKEARRDLHELTPEMVAAANYLFSPEYLELLKRAIYARIGTTALHYAEHKKAIDLVEAIGREEIGK